MTNTLTAPVVTIQDIIAREQAVLDAMAVYTRASLERAQLYRTAKYLRGEYDAAAFDAADKNCYNAYAEVRRALSHATAPGMAAAVEARAF